MGYTNLTDQNTRIYLQTGMDNSLGDAVKSAQALSELLGQPVGVIVNGTEGLAGDVGEYLPDSLSMKDVLNEYTYRQLNAKGPILIITHSAGNEDARKALNVGALYDHQYNNLSFLSLASPVGVSAMQAATSQGSTQFLGQISDWRDPITYSKTAGVVSVGSLCMEIKMNKNRGLSPIFRTSAAKPHFTKTVVCPLFATRPLFATLFAIPPYSLARLFFSRCRCRRVGRHGVVDERIALA